MKPPHGEEFELDPPWKLFPVRKVLLKGGQELEIVEIAQDTGGAMTYRRESAEQRAKRSFAELKRDGDFKPKRYTFEPIPESFTKPSYP